MAQAASLLEVIVCSVTDAIEAERGGAGRLEIVRELERGGLTPPIKLVEEIISIVSVPVRVMLRENDGYELESDAEKERLCAGAREFSQLPIDGLVVGFLRKGRIDVDTTQQILRGAPRLRATFHHAFESAEQFEAIHEIKTLTQVDRILAHGGNKTWPEKIDRLRQYQQKANPEIVILAGGGLDRERIREIAVNTNIREFHVGRAARVSVSAHSVVQSARVKELVEAMSNAEGVG